MTGYNRLEQAVGAFLDRFPRTKGTVETAYQRTSYRLFADSGFEYELHDDAELRTAEVWCGGAEQTGGRFVGFYDVCPWNRSMTRYFVHETDDSDDSDGNPTSIVVLEDGTATTVGSTEAWNYQQGSRTQWHPTRAGTLVFNDVEAGDAVTRVVDVDGETVRTVSRPVQAVNPTGGEFLSVNYRRLDRNSPGYGYGTDDGSSLPPPDSDGIFRVGFDGESELIVPLSDLREAAGGDVSHTAHYIHHVLYAPDGERFVFLHRWMDGEKRRTRLFVADRDGNRRLLLENRNVSHFSWLDDERIFMWGGSEAFGNGYHVVDVESGELTYVGALDGYSDGHPSVSPDGEWVVTDSYPNRLRKRSLTLYHLDSERVVRLGEFLAPFGFDGPRRCDHHPRWSPDGKFVSIDSVHEGVRRSYVVDVSSLTG